MYPGKTYSTKEDIRKACIDNSHFGVTFNPEDIEKADKLELHHSSFTDPGPDFDRYILYCGDNAIAQRTIEGY